MSTLIILHQSVAAPWLQQCVAWFTNTLPREFRDSFSAWRHVQIPRPPGPPSIPPEAGDSRDPQPEYPFWTCFIENPRPKSGPTPTD